MKTILLGIKGKRFRVKTMYCAYLKNGALIGTYKRLKDAKDCTYGLICDIKKVKEYERLDD